MPGRDGTLRTEQRGDGVMALWLDRPAARNALDPSLVSALLQAFAASEVRAFVLGSADPSCFCAGADLGLANAERALSLVVAGCGYGAPPEAEAGFRRESAAIAEAFRSEGAAAVAPRYAVGPARVQLQNRNRPAWETFVRQLAEHASEGSALTMLGVQSRRPSLYAMREQLAALRVPTLLLVGDEDDGCLEANLMLKRTVPSAGLVVLPRTGHTSNLEDPAVFNRTVGEFIGAVQRGEWRERDPRSQTGSITGMSD